MSQEERTHVLKALRPHTRIKYIGPRAGIFTPGAIAYKVKNGRAPHRTHYIIATIAGTVHYIPYKHLTCDAIEMYEALTRNTPQQHNTK